MVGGRVGRGLGTAPLEVSIKHLPNPNPHPHPNPDQVSIKYRCGPSPSVARFLVLVYADAWQHRLLETWEIVVHSLQRVDLHALVGQASHAKALLKGPAGHQTVQCFSSAPKVNPNPNPDPNPNPNPNPYPYPCPYPSPKPNLTKELRLRPAAPFALAPGALNEVDLSLRPTHAGRKQYVVHAVDLQRGALLSSWLVCAVNRLPAVTKAFSLSVNSARSKYTSKNSSKSPRPSRSQ